MFSQLRLIPFLSSFAGIIEFTEFAKFLGRFLWKETSKSMIRRVYRVLPGFPRDLTSSGRTTWSVELENPSYLVWATSITSITSST